MMMSFVSDKPARQPQRPALPTPQQLSAGQRKALRWLATRRRFLRRRGGYVSMPDRISLSVADSLLGLRLAEISYAGGDAQLVLSHDGRALAPVIAERRKTQ
ncbi:MAG: hypothetical protein ABJ337_21350 [Nitratireductor sp.]